jgi:hypothetical protein
MGGFRTERSLKMAIMINTAKPSPTVILYQMTQYKNSRIWLQNNLVFKYNQQQIRNQLLI